MDANFEALLNTETSGMNASEYKAFMGKLIAEVEKHWEDYFVMTCSTNDIIVARACDECDCPRVDDRYYYPFSDDVAEAMAEDGEEEFLGVEDVFNALDIEDCSCDDEDDDLD